MNAETKPKRGLGRGLNALFDDEEKFADGAAAPAPGASNDGAQPAARSRLTAGTEQLYRNESQPRQDFSEESVSELAASLKEHGMLQPILVREILSGKGKYQIVAGERRWRAAQKAQLHEVPISIVDLTDQETLEVALVENLQREDLNPVEEARGYQRLIEEYGRTQEQIAKAIGKSRSHVANTARLLNLPPRVLEYLRQGKLSAGHARTLVNAANAEELAEEMVEKGLNVRAAEALAASSPAAGKRASSRRRSGKDVDTLALERDLTLTLGMKTAIESRDGATGHIKVEFKSLNQLDEIIQRLSGQPSSRAKILTD